uniref:F-box domain-containing protein n=1 Tax=Medicago truncatula TaxID=3880 RepID=I3T0K8_MEDTR|nr:unknown [Medicago truncatula]
MVSRTTVTKSRRSNPTLPFDLVEDILYRLPVKSLAQFKSVSKSWKSLISDSNFTKKNLRVSTTSHRLLFPKLTKGQYIFNACTLSSPITTKGTATAMQHPLNIRKFDKIRGSCHGILCLELHQRFAILWNPFINKYASLPPLEIPWSNTIYSCFGYDHSTDSYKVAAFIKWMPNSEIYKTYVHTMGTTSWRMIQDFPCTPYLKSGKFVSWTFNWLAYKDKYSVSSLLVVSLHLENESYGEILQPDYGSVDVLSISLWVLRDCLSILSNSNTFSDVWLMKEYGNQDSWTRLFRVPYMGGVGSDPYTKALYVYEDDQVLLEYMMKLVVYNSRDGTF